MNQTTFLTFILLLAITSSTLASRYNVISYGAKPDGKTDSTNAFLKAWAMACGSTKPSTIYVPKGRFLVRDVTFEGPCKNNVILISINGTLVAPADYNVIGNSDNWLFFNNVDGVSILGGILDAQGSSLWTCKNSGKSCPTGASSLGFQNSNNILVNGLTSLNSQMFNIVINGCQNVLMKKVKVSSSRYSPNTDGIHVQLSTGVTILNTKITTGDDCVSIGPGAANLWIENVACGPGHGISIGSLGKDLVEAGVQNVTVKKVTFTGTQNGVRIKSWARASNGFATNILFQHITMNNVQNPIVIDQNYCPDNKNCPREVSGVKISDVTYDDIHGTSATEVAMKLDCSSEKPCNDLKLKNVKLNYKNAPASASCNNTAGTATGVLFFNLPPVCDLK